MKFRLFALILSLSLFGWAQETPAAPNSTPAPQAKGCCHHNMADMKDCKKNGCCTDGKCCGEAKGDKTAMGCCGNSCERHPHAPAQS